MSRIALSKMEAPFNKYIRGCDLMEGFLCYEFEGLIHGGAYFGNLTVIALVSSPPILYKLDPSWLINVWFPFDAGMFRKFFNC